MVDGLNGRLARAARLNNADDDNHVADANDDDDGGCDRRWRLTCRLDAVDRRDASSYCRIWNVDTFDYLPPN